MKKIILKLLIVLGTLTAQAEDYSYLTFVTFDGAKISVMVESLTLSISDSMLTAGEQSFALSNLSKMYFSNINETMGIETISIENFDDVAEIYDLQGHKFTKAQIKRGVYIVKTNSKTYKIAVK